MKTSRLWPGVLAIVVAYSGPLAAQSASDMLLERQGQFAIGDNRAKVIVGRSATKAYHVCMDAGAHAVPLKVRHDSKETVVQPGECKLIEASTIKLATAGKLDSRMLLIGARRNVSRVDQLKADNPAVQAARHAPAQVPDGDRVARVDP